MAGEGEEARRIRMFRNVFLAAVFVFLVNSVYGGDMDTKYAVVVLETNQGTIEIKLMPETAPKACENFMGLVEKGYYNGIIFHRVIKEFMIHGGDPTGTGRGGNVTVG